MTETLTFRSGHSELSFIQFDNEKEMEIRFYDLNQIENFYLSQWQAEELVKHLNKCLEKINGRT